MEETLRRLIGGPHPKEVAGIISAETADIMRAQLTETDDTALEEKQEIRERFE